MLLSERYLIAFDDEHGSLDSATISVDLDLSLVDVPHDRVLLWQLVASSHLSDVGEKL